MKIVLAFGAVALASVTSQAAFAQDASAFAGPYLGVQVSAARAQDRHTDLDYWYNDLVDARYEDGGAMAGAKAGYDHVSGSLLVGAFAEVQFGKLNTVVDVSPDNPTYAIGAKTDMLGSVRGKLGVTSGKLAASVNGGWAFSDADHLMGDTDGSTEGYAEKGDRSGYVLGAGVQYAVSNNVNLGLDFSHYQFGTKTHEVLEDGTGLDYFFEQQDKFQTVSFSINYSF